MDQLDRTWQALTRAFLGMLNDVPYGTPTAQLANRRILVATFVGKTSSENPWRWLSLLTLPPYDTLSRLTVS